MTWTRQDERDFVEAERERHLKNIWVFFLWLVDELDEWPELWLTPKYRREIKAYFDHALELRGFDPYPSEGVGQRESIAPGLRRAILDRDGYACVLCGDTRALELDHIEPASRGGVTTPENLRVLCRPCNRRKAAR